MLQDLLWKVDSGLVRTYTFDEEGTIATLGLWGPGDVMGYPLATVEPYHIECLSKVQVHRLQVDQYQALEQALWSHLSQGQALIKIRQGSIRDRLEQFLAWLTGKFGKSCQNGYHIPFKLTHQDIAEAVDTSRVTITRSLGTLEAEESIRWSHNQRWVSARLVSAVNASKIYRL